MGCLQDVPRYLYKTRQGGNYSHTDATPQMEWVKNVEGYSAYGLVGWDPSSASSHRAARISPRSRTQGVHWWPSRENRAPSSGYLGHPSGIPQIKPTFLDIAPSGIPSNIIPHSKGVKCGLIRSNSPFSYSNHRPAKPKIPKPLVYAQVSPLGTSFATP